MLARRIVAKIASSVVKEGAGAVRHEQAIVVERARIYVKRALSDSRPSAYAESA